MQQRRWRKLCGQEITVPIETEVKRVLMRERTIGNDLLVCIGTDSQVKGLIVKFATVIVFVRKGNGAFMYINSEISTRVVPIKQRMLEEVARSIDVAFGLCDLFTAFNVALEVHVDINTNPNFKSNEALNEAMGYIRGMGFAFNSKPYAFASSSCANKVVQ